MMPTEVALARKLTSYLNTLFERRMTFSLLISPCEPTLPRTFLFNRGCCRVFIMFFVSVSVSCCARLSAETVCVRGVASAAVARQQQRSTWQTLHCRPLFRRPARRARGQKTILFSLDK